MKKGDEVIILKITKEAFTELYNDGLIGVSGDDWELKAVEIKDESYPEDPRWKQLKDASTKAYKDLKEYEFIKRGNGKV